MKEIKGLLTDISSDPDYSINYNEVVDLRQCNFDVNPSLLPDFVDFLQYDLKINGPRNIIFLTSKPNEVVLTTIFGQLTEHFQIKAFITSTTDKTIQLLNNPNLNKTKLDKILDDLSESLE